MKIIDRILEEDMGTNLRCMDKLNWYEIFPITDLTCYFVDSISPVSSGSIQKHKYPFFFAVELPKY